MWPDKPLIVVLTGTDLYRDIHNDAVAQRSLALATHLVVLQDAGLAEVPAAWRGKTQVIYQSASRLLPAVKSARSFRALMVGHLRPEKDPLTFIRAARQTATRSLRFVQIGDALESSLAKEAEAAQEALPGYRWLGGMSRADARQHIKRAHVLVNCSIMEGGAQVIVEAIQSGTPVLASRISGNVGMLGVDYAGYFEPGRDSQLAELVTRCAADPSFLRLLQDQCQLRALLFDQRLEKSLVINLVTRAIRTAQQC